MTEYHITLTADNFTIWIALASAALALVALLVCTIFRGERIRESASRAAKWLYVSSFAAVAWSSIYLLQQILSERRYDIAYIFQYSGPNDPLLYKISALWAGQEGSLLTWALLGAIIGLPIVARAGKSAPAAAACVSAVQVFLLALLVGTDPFTRMAGYQAGAVGAGLNPLLKNPWMAIHPPVVFLGYALSAIPAAFALDALVRGDVKAWAAKSLPWAVFGWLSLTAGIALGMIWSYEVLGWGGYWAWDPVENASLVPWLTSTALVHGLVIQRYRGAMARANVVLALGTFILVLYATFLTRSGVLQDISVHSFSTPGGYIYEWLLGFLIFALALSVVLVAVGWRRLAGAAVKPMDFATVAGAVVLALFAAVVLIGTSYPLIQAAGEWISPARSGHPRPTELIQPRFYNMCAPLAAAIVGLIAISIRWWKRNTGAVVAHAGVALAIIGIVLSSTGDSRTLALGGGKPREAYGYSFAYDGNDVSGIRLTFSHGGRDTRIVLPVEYSPSGNPITRPKILSNPVRDIYIAFGGIRSTTVTPTASMSGHDWLALPVEIPGSNATLTLIGMQVEADSARLRYSASGREPEEITVSAGHPAEIDGYTLSFGKFVSTGSMQADLTAGVNITVTGRDIAERLIITVSRRPFISLLWAGCILIIVGGAMALRRRYMECGGSTPL